MAGSDHADCGRIENARCPRCGYDLRGQCTTWTAECPLEGTCTECGLRVLWAEVLCPEKFEPPWCVEFAPRRRVVSAAAMTGIQSLRPWRFWSRLKMSQRIRWHRLVLYLVLLLGPLLLAYVIAQGSAAIYVRSRYGQQLQSNQRQLTRQLQKMQRTRDAIAGGARSSATLFGGKTRALPRLDMQIGRIQAEIATPTTINHSYVDAALEAIVFPLGKSSWGTVTGGPRMGGRYVPPAQIWYALTEVMSQSGKRLTGFSFDALFESVVWLVLGLALILVFPLTLVLLPVSRRRAKVQWRHIVRVTTYGLAIPIMIVLAGCIVTGICFLVGFGSWEWCVLMLARYGPPILLLTWWTAAIGRFLKIPHGLAVAVLHTIIAAGVILFVAWPLVLPVITDWI